MQAEGFEPPTPDLKGRYSTPELRLHMRLGLVPETGLEPVRPYGQRVLSPLCLPFQYTPAHLIRPEGGTRTHTVLQPADFESATSADSVTSGHN